MDLSNSRTLRLGRDDNVIVALHDLEPEAEIETERIRVKNNIPSGHKIARMLIHIKKENWL